MAHAEDGDGQPSSSSAAVSEDGEEGVFGAERQQSSEAEDFRRHQQSSDRTSAALAERMLQGWALLNVYCPR